MTALLLVWAATSAASPTSWKPLAPGVEYLALQFVEAPEFSDGKLHVVRIDPAKAELRFTLASEDKTEFRTAAQIAESAGYVAVINAGMYEASGAAVGYLRNGDHVNKAVWNDYKSLLAFRPMSSGLPKATVADLDAADSRSIADKYRSVIQNLRLIGDGHDVWTNARPRKWSEAAVAEDRQGRILFLFIRTPMTMTEFNQKLLASSLDVVRAMHVEGGPEASLSIRAKDLSLDLCGSYESGFKADDSNAKQWAIPNLLGVARQK